MIVAPRSINEWPASERIANDPVLKPTSALAMVNPADAAIEDRATCSFSVCIWRGCNPNGDKIREALLALVLMSEVDRRSTCGCRACDGVENVDIREQLLGGEAIGRPALDSIGPGLEVHPDGIRV